MLLDYRGIEPARAQRGRNQQTLCRNPVGVERCLQLLVHDAFVRRMHVDHDEASLILGKHVYAGELRQRKAERGSLGCRWLLERSSGCVTAEQYLVECRRLTCRERNVALMWCECTHRNVPSSARCGREAGGSLGQ